MRSVLDSVSPDGLLRVQEHSRQLFAGAIRRVKEAMAPSDEIALDVRPF
jgi:hypothetical protein